jgi:hypothetical protein
MADEASGQQRTFDFLFDSTFPAFGRHDKINSGMRNESRQHGNQRSFIQAMGQILPFQAVFGAFETGVAYR